MTTTWHFPKRPVPQSRPESVNSDDLNHTQSTSNDGERPRKRVRKGTKSCWECKRRKIKCQLSSEDVPVCSGCLSRGTTCLSQEFPEERDTSSGLQVGERLGRVERLLETLVAKITAYEEEATTHKILTPESVSIDVLDESTVDINPATEASPYLGLFNNVVIGQPVQSLSPANTPISRTSYSGSRTSTTCGRPTKNDRVLQALLELLPSDADLDIIFKTSYSAALLDAMVWSCKTSDPNVTKSTQNTPPLDRQSPISITRTLLYLALFLQQLHPNSDHSNFNIKPSVKVRMEHIMATVNTLVTSDDELVTSMEGIECLILQGMYLINDGSPRRAWLTFRRALNLAQLMGLQRDNSSDGVESKKKWNKLVQGDRYLSLLLGLPAGSNYDQYEPEENFQNPNIDKEELFARKLSDISLRIIQRNQTGTTPPYAGTQEIDDLLDNLAKEMPSSWWEVTSHTSDDESQQSPSYFDRLMAQIWFFQIQGLVHLPFMLKASTERRYEYSKFSCLKACREVMWRYLSMRKSQNKSFCCKVVDFGALTATVALFLGILNTTSGNVTPSPQEDADRALIKMVHEVMENFAKNANEIVAAQSVTVIKSLLAAEHPKTQSEGNLRLTIPYFGTISIVRPTVESQKQTQSPPHQSTESSPLDRGQPPFYGRQSSTNDASLTAANLQSWQNLQIPAQHSLNYPTVSFQSTYFNEVPAAQMNAQTMGWSEADTLFFDGLLNADLEGNWAY